MAILVIPSSVRTTPEGDLIRSRRCVSDHVEGRLLVGVGGSLLGTRLNAVMDPNLLLLLFSALILVAAWRMSTACPSCTAVGSDRAIAADAGFAEGRSSVITRAARRTSVARARSR